MRLSTIDFGSLFSYAPWGTLDAYLRSKTFRTILKNDEYLVSRSNKILMSDYIAGFAALRTISDSDQFIKINDSCVGKIKLIGNETFRDP